MRRQKRNKQVSLKNINKQFGGKVVIEVSPLTRRVKLRQHKIGRFKQIAHFFEAPIAYEGQAGFKIGLDRFLRSVESGQFVVLSKDQAEMLPEYITYDTYNDPKKRNAVFGIRNQPEPTSTAGVFSWLISVIVVVALTTAIVSGV